MFRLLGFLVLLTAGLFGFSPPAGAHAQLEGTVPTNGSVVDVAPQQVSVLFNEKVGVGLGGVRVFNSDARRVDSGPAVSNAEAPHTLDVPVRALSTGSYVITWRVVSADGHPVRGASTFRVGAGDQNEGVALSQKLLAADGGSEVTAAAFATSRALTFLSLFCAVGGLAFLVFVARRGDLLRRFTQVSFAVLAVASLAEFALQGSYAGGRDLASAFQPGLWSEAASLRYGQTALLRAALAALVALALFSRVSVHRFVVPLLAVSATGGIVSVSLAGHAATGRWPVAGFVLDVAHVAAACAWIGGLCVLGAVALRARFPVLSGAALESEANTEAGLLPVMRRFSSLALICVLVLAITGTIQGYRQIGSLDHLFDNRYGFLLFLKVIVFLLLVAVASMSRRSLGQESTDDVPSGVSTVKRVRRQVRVEVMLAVALVGITSLLVNAAPPPAVAGGTTSFYDEFPVNDLIAAVSVESDSDNASTSLYSAHLYMIESSGPPAAVADATMKMTLPDKGIEAIPVPLEHLTPDHFASYGFVVPIKGTWTVDLTIRIDDLNQKTVQFEVPIR